MKNRPIPIFEISGGPRERGRQYGETAREQIDVAIGYYQAKIAHSLKMNWAEVQQHAQAWVPVVEAYSPGILDEVHGIAEGSNHAFEEILVLNGRGELSYGNPFAGEENEGCSAYAITAEASGDGHVYCGQNWDWMSGIADTVVVVRVVQPPKPTLIMQLEAGQVGRHGANSAGLALNANGLGEQFGKGITVPAPFVRRRVLDSTNMHDALKAIFDSTQNNCTNLLLTHKDGVVIDVETTPGRHGWMFPQDGLLVHTNHFIAFVPPQIDGSYRPFSPDSLFRLTQIERVLKQAKQAKTPQKMRQLIATALRDHFSLPDSVCNHPDDRRHPLDRTETIASSIVDLTTGNYYLAPGLPCKNEYQKLPWNIYD